MPQRKVRKKERDSFEFSLRNNERTEGRGREGESLR